MKARSNNFQALGLKICPIFVLLLLLTGCQSGYNPLLPGTYTIYDPIYATTNSFAELTSQSTVVVLGRVKPDSRVINIARDGTDISKPDLSLLVLAQVYQVDVERVIKGVLPSSPLFIIQAEGFLGKPQASIEPSAEDVKLARRGYPYAPFIEGQRYLLFLHPLEGFEQQRFFVGIRNPWRFNATDENNVFSESPMLTDTQPAPLAEIIRQIETASTPIQTVMSPLPTPLLVETALPTATSEPAIEMVGEYVIASSLASLTSRATLIVLGRVKPDSRVFNAARDVNDISKPDLRLLGLAQVYQVDVERVIKGVLPSSPLFIIQVEGFLSKSQASIEPSPEDAKLARQGYEYMPFTPGGRYLLFLHPLEGFEQQGFFAGPPHPWRFNATDENNVIPEGPVSTNIQPAPLAEIIKQIEALPTPMPTVISPLPTPPPVATAKAAP